jgi:hypothetical protein
MFRAKRLKFARRFVDEMMSRYDAAVLDRLAAGTTTPEDDAVIEAVRRAIRETEGVGR